MIRIITVLFFLLNFSFSYAQNTNAGSKHPKQKSIAAQKDSTKQEIIVYISYEVQADSTTANLQYISRPSEPAPTAEMIEEAMRIVSKMKVVPNRDSAGELITTKQVTRIKFISNKN